MTSSPPIVRDPGVVAFAILGPLQVIVGGVVLDVPGPKERLVLAMLVASAGEIVLTDRIADAVWGEDLPRSSGKAVQNLVLRMRKLVGGEVIGRRQSGYALRAAADAVDAHRFEDLVHQGRERRAGADPAAAVAAYGSTLELSPRGPAGRAHGLATCCRTPDPPRGTAPMRIGGGRRGGTPRSAITEHCSPPSRRWWRTSRSASSGGDC